MFYVLLFILQVSLLNFELARCMDNLASIYCTPKGLARVVGWMQSNFFFTLRSANFGVTQKPICYVILACLCVLLLYVNWIDKHAIKVTI